MTSLTEILQMVGFDVYESCLGYTKAVSYSNGHQVVIDIKENDENAIWCDNKFHGVGDLHDVMVYLSASCFDFGVEVFEKKTGDLVK